MKKVLVIKNEVAELERLAIFIEQVAEESNLDPETTMNLNLALEEVVSNVIQVMLLMKYIIAYYHMMRYSQ